MAAPGPPAGSSDRIVNEPARTVVRAVVGFPGTEAVGRPGEIGKLVRGSRGCGPGARPGPAIRLRDLDFLSGLCQPGSRSLDGRPAPREQVRVRVARPDYSEGRDFDRRQRVLGRSQCDPGRRPTLFRQLADQSERARGRPPARGPQAMERPSGADGPRGPQPIRHHPRRSLSRPDLGSRHPSIQPAGSHRGERRAEPDLGSPPRVRPPHSGSGLASPKTFRSRAPPGSASGSASRPTPSTTPWCSATTCSSPIGP